MAYFVVTELLGYSKSDNLNFNPDTAVYEFHEFVNIRSVFMTNTNIRSKLPNDRKLEETILESPGLHPTRVGNMFQCYVGTIPAAAATTAGGPVGPTGVFPHL